jgi:hypothetical protein
MKILNTTTDTITLELTRDELWLIRLSLTVHAASVRAWDDLTPNTQKHLSKELEALRRGLPVV